MGGLKPPKNNFTGVRDSGRNCFPCLWWDVRQGMKGEFGVMILKRQIPYDEN